MEFVAAVKYEAGKERHSIFLTFVFLNMFAYML